MGTEHLPLRLGGGCGCKVPRKQLDALLSSLDLIAAKAVVSDSAIETFVGRGDAGIFEVTPDMLIATSVDFGAPVSRNPHRWGAIAAQNALSDLYAVGAAPAFALNILCWPEDSDYVSAQGVLEGGAGILMSEGVSLLGGHTVRSTDMLYGLAVVGFVNKAQRMSLAGALPGDHLILTKPLGSGVLLAAQQAGLTAREEVDNLEEMMLQSNRPVSSIAIRHQVRCATDVTGFGLIGHLEQMLAVSEVDGQLVADSVPTLPGVLDYLAQGIVPTRERALQQRSHRMEYGGSARKEIRPRGSPDVGRSLAVRSGGSS